MLDDAQSSASRNLADGDTLEEPPSEELLQASAQPQRLDDLRLQRLLGRGGMGVVHAAWDPLLERQVAVKLLHPWASVRDAERFRTEGRAAARLEHEGIVGVHRIGACDGRLYMVLDYVPGGSLKLRLKREGGLPQEEACDLLERLARAVAHAHHHGILHRDLKPQNVLLDARGRPKVTDFGLARDLRDVSTRITYVGEVLGTPAYMAPEQAGGGDVDARADVYALGAILYETLAGVPPFQGPALRVIEQVVHEAPPPLVEVRPDVCPRLARICERCLSKSPERRYGSARALAAALARWRRGTRPPRPAPGVAQPRRVPRPGSRREAALAMALVGGCLLAAWLLGALVGAEEPAARTQELAWVDPVLSDEALGFDAEPARPGQAEASRRAGRAGVEASPAPTPRRKALRPRKDHEAQVLDPPPAETPPGAPAAGGVVDAWVDPAPSRLAATESGKANVKLASASIRPDGPDPAPASFRLLRSYADPADADGAARSEAQGLDETEPEPAPSPEARVEPASGSAAPPPAFDPAPALPPTPAPSPTLGPVANYAELLLPERATFYVWEPYLQLNDEVGGFVGRIDTTPAGELLISHRPRGVARLGRDGLFPEVALSTPISGSARIEGGAFFSTSDTSRDGAGDVWLRDDTGRWTLSLDTQARTVITAHNQGQLYAFLGAGPDAPVQVSLLVRSLGWRSAVTLDVPGYPTAAVGHDGWVYVGISDDEGEAELYRVRGGVFEELDEASGPDAEPGDTKRITALLSVRGHLFVASGTYGADGAPLRGAVEVLTWDDTGDAKLERLENLGGDAPQALAYQDGTIQVGTARGELRYLLGVPDADDVDVEWVVEAGVLPNAGIHALTVIDPQTLLLGVAGPLGAEVYRRVAVR